MKVTPTATQNLVKDGVAGIYYARVKIKGLSKYRSLEKTVATTAKLRLQDKLKEIRESFPAEGATGPLENSAAFEPGQTQQKPSNKSERVTRGNRRMGAES